MNSQLRCVYKGYAELAEGPVWHDGALWWVNITAGTLNKLDLESGINESRGIGEYLGCAVPSPETPGNWWVAGHRRLLELDWATGKTEILADFQDHPNSIRFNDGKLDSEGRFWFGTLSFTGEAEKACLYVRHRNGKTEKALTGLTLSNRIAWNHDESSMFHIDTPTRSIFKYSYDSNTGGLGDKKTLIKFDSFEGWPDGMCYGLENDLWIAMWGGSQVVRVSAKSGIILQRISLPVEQPSSVCLVPTKSNKLSLAITTAWQGLGRSEIEGPNEQGSIYLLEFN